jgi:hypothetical protein
MNHATAMLGRAGRRAAPEPARIPSEGSADASSDEGLT